MPRADATGQIPPPGGTTSNKEGDSIPISRCEELQLVPGYRIEISTKQRQQTLHAIFKRAGVIQL